MSGSMSLRGSVAVMETPKAWGLGFILDPAGGCSQRSLGKLFSDLVGLSGKQVFPNCHFGSISLITRYLQVQGFIGL